MPLSELIRGNYITEESADARYLLATQLGYFFQVSVFGRRRYSTTLKVPGDYATLSAALAGVEVGLAAVTGRVLIELQEGSYNGYLPMDSYYFVDIKGMGVDLTTLALVGDAHDTVSWGGGDCVIYDMTITHTGSSLRAGHKDDNIDTSKLTYSRGGAVRCRLTGSGKSAFGMRLYGNQEFWLIDCDIATDTTEGLYINNAPSQSKPCAVYLVNTRVTSSASYAVTLYSNGSGQKDRLTCLGGSLVGVGGSDMLMANTGAGAGEWDAFVDPDTAVRVITNNAGTLHRSIGQIYTADIDPINYALLKAQMFFGATSGSATTGFRIYPVVDTYGTRLRVEVWSTQENANINSFDIDPYDGRVYFRRLIDCNGGIKVGPAPASSSASGEARQIASDGNYVYICTSANTWKRAALSSF